MPRSDEHKGCRFAAEVRILGMLQKRAWLVWKGEEGRGHARKRIVLCTVNNSTFKYVFMQVYMQYASVYAVRCSYRLRRRFMRLCRSGLERPQVGLSRAVRCVGEGRRAGKGAVGSRATSKYRECWSAV